MANESAAAPFDAAAYAKRLALALDAIEAQLDALRPGAEIGAVASALAGPVAAFDALAKEGAA
jgi:hypothetical protein